MLLRTIVLKNTDQHYCYFLLTLSRVLHSWNFNLDSVRSNDYYFCFVIETGFVVSNTRINDAELMNSSAVERMTRYRTLLLKYFYWPRHPLKNQRQRIEARTGIMNELKEILVKVPNVKIEIQEFNTEILYSFNESTAVNGKNIIVTFHGRNQHTKNDEILLIGGHYDSENYVRPLFPINDGSGVVAILECIRSLSKDIKGNSFVLLNSVIFVLFDVQRSKYVILHIFIVFMFVLP